MGLIVLKDTGELGTIYRLVSPLLMEWVLSPPTAEISQKERIPDDVHDALLGPGIDPRLRFLVPVSMNRENDRALLTDGKEFATLEDVGRYIRRHRIEIYAQYHGLNY